jgi:uncharacterized protein DUF6766
MPSSDPKLHRRSALHRYGFLWATMVLFIGCVAGHWTFGWTAYANEQRMHGETPRFSDFVPEALRDTFENWQAEFMSVAWQIAGLAVLYAVGSPQSREGDERKEKKLDLILRKLDPKNLRMRSGNSIASMRGLTSYLSAYATVLLHVRVGDRRNPRHIRISSSTVISGAGRALMTERPFEDAEQW